jgi:UDP-N-acetyl-D-glucosamine dehydrogenase
LFGLAYKKDVGDIRESPALDILELLDRRGAVVSYSDPYVPTFGQRNRTIASISERQALVDRPDCMIVCTDHSSFDWKPIVESGIPLVDSRNALRGYSSPNIVRLSGRRYGR